MIRRDEAVLRRDGVEPFAEPALLDLDDAVAARADEVMVMGVRAEPLAELRAVMRERVDYGLVGEERERAVDGREPGLRVALAQPAPELLRRDVVPFS